MLIVVLFVVLALVAHSNECYGASMYYVHLTTAGELYEILMCGLGMVLL